MGNIDLVYINKQLTKAVRLIVDVRRLAAEVGCDWPELAELEREFREAAGQVQVGLTLCKNGETVELKGR